MKYLAIGIGYLLTWIYNFTGSYGVSVILLTLLTRLCLFPLYSKQFKYSQAMAAVQPKIKEIQTRYAANKALMNEKLNEVYAENNISPASGCLPTLVQMPIILGLYSLLRDPLAYISSSVMAIAVHESFLWVSDLSQPDSIILPLLAGITTYFATSAGASNAADSTSAGMMKTMKYFFPLMIFFMGRSFPSALALYWAIGNLFTMLQGIYFKKTNKKQQLIDDVTADMRQERKKNRNKK